MKKDDKIIKKVDNHVQNNNLEDAKLLLQDNLLEKPKNKKLLWKITEIYLRLNDDKNAVKTLKKIVNYYPNLTDKVYKYLNDDFFKYIRNSKHASRLIFEISVDKNDIKNSISTLKVLSEDEIQSIVDKYKNKIAKLKKVNDLKKLLKSNSDLFYYLFFSLYASGDYETSFNIIADFIENDIYYQYTRITELLTKLKSVEEDNPYIYFYLGKLFLKNDNYTDAIKEFKNGIRVNNALVDFVLPIAKQLSDKVENKNKLYDLLALCFYFKQDYKTSVEFFSKIVENTDNEEMLDYIENILSDIYLNIGSKNYLIIAMTQIYIKKQNYEEAIRKFIQIKKYENSKILNIAQILMDKTKEKDEIYKIFANYYLKKQNYTEFVDYLSKLFNYDRRYSDYIISFINEIDDEEITDKSYFKLLGDIYLKEDNLKKSY